MIGIDDRLGVSREHLPERPKIEPVPLRTQRRQVLLRQAEQPHRRSQAAPMLRMRRMLKLLLQMDESAGGLDQPFEILRIVRSRRSLEPDLFEDIVRLVVLLLVPAAKKRAVIGMIGDGAAAGFGPVAFQRLHELGNSLAFTHEGPNLVAPAMMGKRARFSLREGERLHDRRRSEK